MHGSRAILTADGGNWQRGEVCVNFYVALLMRADAAKELITLSYINYEGHYVIAWLAVDVGEPGINMDLGEPGINTPSPAAVTA
jgi:hypothetical protein